MEELLELEEFQKAVWLVSDNEGLLAGSAIISPGEKNGVVPLAFVYFVIF